MIVDLTDEEAKAIVTQLSGRIDDLKALALNAKDFKRIMELVPFIATLESAQMKLMGVGRI